MRLLSCEKTSAFLQTAYHYRNKTIQPWDAIHAWDLGFFSGNVVKYVARHREKNGVQDLKKARHYLDKLIELMEKGK